MAIEKYFIPEIGGELWLEGTGTAIIYFPHKLKQEDKEAKLEGLQQLLLGKGIDKLVLILDGDSSDLSVKNKIDDLFASGPLHISQDSGGRYDDVTGESLYMKLTDDKSQKISISFLRSRGINIINKKGQAVQGVLI